MTQTATGMPLRDDTGDAVLSVEGLSKTYPPTTRQAGRPPAPAVDEVSFDVRPGELLTLLGPSGCGKTTTLRSVAGLEVPDRGRIVVGGNVLFDSGTGVNHKPNKRNLAMVFQSYAIWPHMSVAKNVAFPLDVKGRRDRATRSAISARVGEVLDLVGLSGYEDRPSTSLSGGQQQRLAFARALVMDPSLMLLDEPLSNLDAKLRESMRFEIKRLQQETGVASIYVTHDQEEALAMSTRIAVMNEGRIVQLGTPEEIYERPADDFVAAFVGTSNMLRGIVGERRDDRVLVDLEDLQLWALDADLLAAGDLVVACVRPDDVALAPISRANDAAESVNSWEGQVAATAYMGRSVDRVLRIGARELRARSNTSVDGMVGDRVAVQIDPSRIRLLRTS